jgi:DNA-binding transcriptional LysR family regulator
LYCRIVEDLTDNPSHSLCDVATSLGTVVSRVSGCIHHLEKLYRDRAPFYIVNKRLTDSGKSFYRDVAKPIVVAYEDLMPWGALEVPEVHVATTNTLLVHILPGVATNYEPVLKNKVRLRFHECDWPQIVEKVRRFDVDFGIGPVPDAAQPGVKLDILPFARDWVVICRMNHRFARERVTTLTLRQLQGQNLVRLSKGLQPGLDNQLVQAGVTDDDQFRVEVQTYAAVIAHVCTSVDLVALVPGWYSVLDELRKQGRLYYTGVDGAEPVRLAIYSSPARPLRPVASSFLKEITEKTDTIQPRPVRWAPPTHRANLPSARELAKCEWYAYHITCKSAGYTPPQWHRGRVALKVHKDGSVTGREEDRDSDDTVLRRYEIKGHYGCQLLFWVAERVGDPTHPMPDRFVTTINTTSPDGYLVGAWTGFDENAPVRQPLSGTVVLSKAQLSLQELQEAARSAMVRFMQNADAEFSSKDQS